MGPLVYVKSWIVCWCVCVGFGIGGRDGPALFGLGGAACYCETLLPMGIPFHICSPWKSYFPLPSSPSAYVLGVNYHSEKVPLGIPFPICLPLETRFPLPSSPSAYMLGVNCHSERVFTPTCAWPQSGEGDGTRDDSGFQFFGERKFSLPRRHESFRFFGLRIAKGQYWQPPDAAVTYARHHPQTQKQNPFQVAVAVSLARRRKR